MLDLTEEVKERIVEDQNFRIHLAKESFYYFFHIYFKHYVSYRTAPFHKEWCDLAQDWEVKFLEILGFRGSAKTGYMMSGLPIWATIVGKTHFTLVISDTFSQVKEHIYNIKTELDENILLNKDFGPFNVIEETSKKEEWQKTSLIIPKYNAKILARSAGQRVRGIRFKQYRPQLVVIDDVEDLKMVRTKEQRDKTFNWLDGDVFPVGEENTKFIIIGNLLHSDAVMNRLKNKIKNGEKEGLIKEYPFFDKQGIPLWSSRFKTKEDIESEKKKYEMRTWQREFLLRIVPEEGQEVKDEWINYYDELPEAELFTQGTGIDLAISKKQTAHFTAMVSGKLYTVNGKPKIYIVPNPVNERLSHYETVKTAKDRSMALGDGTLTDLWVEAVAYQRAATETMELAGLPAEGINISNDKRARLRTAATYIQNKTVLFPKTGCEDLILQLTGFGIEAFDDLCDAFGLCVMGLMSKYAGEPRMTII